MSTTQPRDAVAPPTAPAWLGLPLRGVLLALAAELVAAAVARVVLPAAPGVLAAEPLSRALARGALIALAATTVLLALDPLLGLVVGALRRPGGPPPSGPSSAAAAAARAEAAWLLLLAAAAPWALTRWTFGVVHAGHRLALPVLARAVDGYLPWLTAALAAEVLLRVARLGRGASPVWWLLRAMLGLGWAVLLLAVVSGPDLLRGDPLEWGMRLGDAHLSQEWLNRAPLAPARWWPALQVGAMAALLLTLLAAAREAWLAWRGWKAGGWRGAAGR